MHCEDADAARRDGHRHADDASAATGSRPGAAPTAACRPIDYGATMFNAEGDDDDCKYHVKWTATPIGVRTPTSPSPSPLTKLADVHAGTGAGDRAPRSSSPTRTRPPTAGATTEIGGAALQGRPGPVRRARRVDRALPLLRGLHGPRGLAARPRGVLRPRALDAAATRVARRTSVVRAPQASQPISVCSLGGSAAARPRAASGRCEQLPLHRPVRGVRTGQLGRERRSTPGAARSVTAHTEGLDDRAHLAR